MGLKRIDKLGDSRKHHPIPLRLRNPFLPRDLGGSEGYRGRGFYRNKPRAIARDRGRSTISGLDASQTTLAVDHINPYRLGGGNRLSNLRTVDAIHHAAIDVMRGAGERPRLRRRSY